jgi:deoxyribonuclease-1
MKQYIYPFLLLSLSLLFGEESYNNLADDDIATIEEEVFSVKGESFSFGKSKRLLATKVYPNHQKAFYSGCSYIIEEKKLVPIHETCGFQYRKNKNRSNRIEWEHIVPAWHFGHQLQCWQKGGRKECRQNNSKFREMESDMHNLVPAIGEINGDRSNFRYGMIVGEERVYGRVNMEIKFSDKKAEPKENTFGEIARTYFYMRDKYRLKISNSQEKLFIAWNNQDPVTRWERKRNQLIKNLQGDENLYITNYEKIEQLGKIPEDDELSSDFDGTRKELLGEYGHLLKNLSEPMATLILLLMTLFVMYKRKNRNK